MDSFALVLVSCGGTAMLALLLSVTKKWRLARRIGQISLWVTLGAVPLAIMIDIVRLWLGGADDEYSNAFLIGRAISHAMNYGVVALPSAMLAGLALRRVNTAAHADRNGAG